jgi:Alpha-kinase family/von Willebrand factor type A domain
MVGEKQQTSLISILSTEHARIRRQERDIDKRDLKRALKHGTRQRCWRNRWKIEYDGVIFIVDQAVHREITAYPSPQREIPIDETTKKEHELAKFLILQKSELCKSHTVLVVDNSGSMQTRDIPLHRDRQVAAYATIALEYVAEQLIKQTANNRDVVSLIEFDQEARVVFSREPCSLVLFNKLLQRREAGNFKSRQDIKGREIIRADSNYIPALKLADDLLNLDRHEECSLGLLFFSDGEPSDARLHGWTPIYARAQICACVSKLAIKYGEHLNMAMVGFGNQSGDFSTLEAMVDACKESYSGASASFVYCAKMTQTLGTALTSLATSLTKTRTSLIGRSAHLAGQKREILSEHEAGLQNTWRFFKVIRHGIYGPQHQRLVDLPSLPPGAFVDDNAYLQRVPMQPPEYLALNGHSFGAGAERIAFRCFLSTAASRFGFILGPMVAKETNLVNRMTENAEFHEGFCATQGLASYLATEFNARLRLLPTYMHGATPQITFLPCSLIVLEDHTVMGGSRSVLVEKMLDTQRFKWTKWNDNGGGVEGRPYHAPLDVEYEMELLKNDKATSNGGILACVHEEDSDLESDDEAPSSLAAASAAEFKDSDHVPPSAYLQAFSHFTYEFTNKKVLVCDLQGIYNTDFCPPTFELTDPAIHYRSAKDRKMVYGRTDKGIKGIDLFFATHECSNLCKIVCLNAKNVDWKKGWYDHHEKKFGNV